MSFNLTFEALTEANKGIKTTDIKGKDYAMIHERVAAFRRIIPGGFIETELVRCEDGLYVFKATAGYIDEDRRVALATGHASEREGVGSNINRLSALENAETSAVGRALGNLGLGIQAAIASADEVLNAELNDISKEKIDEIKVKVLRDKLAEVGIPEANVCRLYKIKAIEDMSNKQFVNVFEHWDQMTVAVTGGGDAERSV